MIPVGTDLELKKYPVATLVIIGINSLVFAIEVVLPPHIRDWVFMHFGFSAYTKNPLSPITSMFLHGDICHIVGNMLFLWIFGGPLENRVGTKAFLVYYFGAGLWSKALWVSMELAVDPFAKTYVIGASGAISGLVALYLYRCFYSKLRLVIDPMFLPYRISIPAAPLIIFWFYTDIRGGIESLSHVTKVAYWGHVGGFLFGLAVGRIKRYGHEGRLEQLKDRMLKKLEGGWGWQDAEKELLKLYQIAPKDADVRLDLARLYANKNQLPQAEEHYQFAVQQYFLKNPLYGAFAVLEHLDSIKRPMALHYHLKAAEVLAANSFQEDAYRALLPVIDAPNDRSLLMERAMALFIKLSYYLGKKEEAAEAARVFYENFPRSKYAAEIKKALTMKPDDLFPKKASPAMAVAEKGARDEVDEEHQSLFLRILGFCVEVITQPRFMLVWIVATIFFYIGLIATEMSEESIWQVEVYAFLFAFFAVAIFRIDWLEVLIYGSRQSEKTAQKEVDISMTYNRAVLAERGEDYQKAAELYEKVLAQDPNNIQALFNLARIYHYRLKDMNNALRQYRKLMQLLPEGHPYHQEAAAEVVKSEAKGK